MHASLSQLQGDPAFRERAAALAAAAPDGPVPALDAMLEGFRRFAAGRRREARVALLAKAEHASAEEWRVSRDRLGDAVQGFTAGLAALAELAATLRPLLTPALDDVLGLAADERHPLRTTLRETALSLGFSGEEAGWLFTELGAVGFRPVALLGAGGFEDLETLLACISAGESGLLLAGFARLTGDPEVDERLEKVVVRLREKGLTASFFLVLAVVLAAHAVATRSGSR